MAGQIGLEPTLAEFIATLVDVFREVRRVLRPDGTCFVNMGDSYSGAGYGNHDVNGPEWKSKAGLDRRRDRQQTRKIADAKVGLKPKDLMMVPARLAIALQDDGWYLRSDIIWHKKAPMPESVTDRPTSAHEHVFLLTKQPRYFYDADAVREEMSPESAARYAYGFGGAKNEALKAGDKPTAVVGMRDATEGRNLRNVWTLGPEPYPDAHFATFPTEIPRRCIKAGTSERGCCPACGASWGRVAERESGTSRPKSSPLGARGVSPSAHRALGQPQQANRFVTVTTTGWEPTCACDAGDPVPSTILDPFLGSGTTLLVADQLGRHGIGIELNPEYAEMARRRIVNDAPLFASIA